MWFIKIKKKKTQYLLLAIIFTITVGLIGTCATFTVVANTFVKEFYSGEDTPDIVQITMSKDIVKKTEEWYRLQNKEASNYKEYQAYSIVNKLKINNRYIDIYAGMILPIKDIKELNWKISITEGDKKSSGPKKGEVWMPNTLAKSKGIKVGDEAIIENAKGEDIKLKVSAIINDSNQPSTLIGFNNLYASEEVLDELTGLYKVYLTTLNCSGDDKEKSKDLSKYINEPIQGVIITKSILNMAATMLPNVVGGIGFLAAFLMIIVLVIILRANLWNFILREYKSIGIYKSMGFRDRKIKGIYLKSYTVVAVVSSLVGCILSVPVIRYICNIILKYLGEYKFEVNSLIPLIIVFISFNILVVVNLLFVLKRIDKIKPVTAINIGVTSSKSKLKKSIIKNNASSFCMAINDIFKYKRNNIIIFVTFMVVFYMVIFFVNMKYSVAKIDDNMNNWIGVPKCDMSLRGGDGENSLKDVIEYLNNNDKVKKAIYLDLYNSKYINIDNEKYNVNKELLVVALHDEYDKEYFSVLRGRDPIDRNEVSLSVDLMKKNNLNIGDYITLGVRGKDEKFLVTGEFGTKNGNGQSIRLKMEVVHKEVTGHQGFITLKNKESFNELKNELQQKFKGLRIDKGYYEENFSQVKEILGSVLTVLIIGVVLFSVVNVTNMVLTNNIDNRKTYGIMKAMGFSNKYIRNRVMFRVLILAIVGALVGLAINIVTSRDLFMIAAGMVDGYLVSSFYTVVAIGTLLLLIASMVLICCGGIKKISPVELIVE